MPTGLITFASRNRPMPIVHTSLCRLQVTRPPSPYNNDDQRDNDGDWYADDQDGDPEFHWQKESKSPTAEFFYGIRIGQSCFS
jgi:hypothetical protein